MFDLKKIRAMLDDAQINEEKSLPGKNELYDHYIKALCEACGEDFNLIKDLLKINGSNAKRIKTKLKLRRRG